MACIAEYSHPFPHGRHGGDDDGGLPRKRRRLTSSWDVVPCGYKAQPCPGFAGNGNGEGASPCPLSESSDLTSSSSSNSPNLGGAEGDFWQSRYESPPWRNDDKEGHYVFAVGDNLTPRYKIISKMGQGTFGQVLECWDRKSKDLVAIKVTRGLEKYREDAQIEIDVLNEVAKYDKTGKRRRCNKYFRHGTRLDWPEGASSSNSIRAVKKLPKLGNLVKQHVGHSTVLLIDLLHGLLKFDPSERMTARDALRHPFFKEI